jgi:hypothetical protein
VVASAVTTAGPALVRYLDQDVVRSTTNRNAHAGAAYLRA